MDTSDREQPIKRNANDENEVTDVVGFEDPSLNRVTPVASFPAEVALGLVEGLMSVVRAGHASSTALQSDEDGVVRAQTFEEGDVYMVDKPFDDYPSNRYLMDFYDVTERDICSRMHLHTGTRFVRMITGPGTNIRVSSFSEFVVNHLPGVSPFLPETFVDDMPDMPAGHRRDRYNLIVPENSWVDMQVPRGQSHQFNAIGKYAVIDSVHPEESIEVFRERMSRSRMMAQTVFLAEEQPSSQSCVLPASEDGDRLSPVAE